MAGATASFAENPQRITERADPVTAEGSLRDPGRSQKFSANRAIPGALAAVVPDD
jgi:hypothetical protein